MQDPTEIALTDFARALSRLVGRDKPLSLLEVADDTDVDDQTVSNYLRARTAPSFEWVLTFARLYGGRFQVDVLAILNAAMGPVGFYVGPMKGLDPAFTDANGDGRHCAKDERINMARAQEHLAEAQEASNQGQSDQIRSSDLAAPVEEHLNAAVMRIQAAAQVGRGLVGRRTG